MFIFCMWPFAWLRFAKIEFVCGRQFVGSNQQQASIWMSQTQWKALEFGSAFLVKVSENIHMHGNCWVFHSFPSQRQSIFRKFQSQIDMHVNVCGATTSNASIKHYDRIQWMRILMNSLILPTKLHISIHSFNYNQLFWHGKRSVYCICFS